MFDYLKLARAMLEMLLPSVNVQLLRKSDRIHNEAVASSFTKPHGKTYKKLFGLLVIRFPVESEYALGYGGDRLIFLTMGRERQI
jgi:hypothetical protein